MVEVHDTLLHIVPVNLLFTINALSDFQAAHIRPFNGVSFNSPVVHLDIFADVIAKCFPLASRIGLEEVL
jgi:hypothetical protein